MKLLSRLLCSILLFGSLPAGTARSAELIIGTETLISIDTTWSGEVEMAADVLVLPGATLFIAPGTVVSVRASDSTKTEPEFLSTLTELTVRGRLRAMGTPEAPVVFRFQGASDGTHDGMGDWAGINVDGGGIELEHCSVSGAESAVAVWSGKADIRRCRLEKNRYGLSLLGEAAQASVDDSAITGNDYGVVATGGATLILRDSEPKGNHQQEKLEWLGPGYLPEAPEHAIAEAKRPAPYGSESLLGTIVWKERVVINGVIRIPEKSRLIIMPGTVVEFSRSDTNGDGIGENGLLVMGMLVAKGTKEKPIVFRSAEPERRPGDWDALNIFVSDGFQNLIEHCVIENAYRGLHFHFSNVLVSHADVRNNYRGLQFQESLIAIRDSDIHDNGNALRARDSELEFVDNRVYGNGSGPNIYRASGRVADNIFAANLSDGLRVREGALDVSGNAFVGNRYGLLFAYATAGVCRNNVMAANAESGLILKGTDNVRVEGNFIQNNGTNGISLQGARAEILGNQIAGNGERGIGIQSFAGRIAANNLLGNRLYDLGLDGTMDIDASGNHWGGADLGRAIFDRADDPAKGRVATEPVLVRPVDFTWPRPDILVDTVWEGRIVIPRRVDSRAGSRLAIRPGAKVGFASGRGMWANGAIEAVGTPDQPIVFTTADASRWHQLMLEKTSATFRHCRFEQAETALHSHSSALAVSFCHFTANRTGLMFRGGPVTVADSAFIGNQLGVTIEEGGGRIGTSAISGNRIGIMVKYEKNRGVRIEGNNIEANTLYNIKMGDLNPGEDVDARGNWWGEAAPAETFWDAKEEPGVGFVLFEPFAPCPFPMHPWVEEKKSATGGSSHHSFGAESGAAGGGEGR